MAFQVKPKHVLFKARFEAVESLETNLYYGDSKGVVHLAQMIISDITFIIEHKGEVKVEKKKIDRLSILNVTKQILCLSSGKLTFLDPISLTKLKVLDKDVTAFAVNEFDSIAVAICKKLHLYIYNADNNSFIPYPHSNEITTSDSIIKLSKTSFNLSVE
jgi:hypothetical protein